MKIWYILAIRPPTGSFLVSMESRNHRASNAAKIAKISAKSGEKSRSKFKQWKIKYLRHPTTYRVLLDLYGISGNSSMTSIYCYYPRTCGQPTIKRQNRALFRTVESNIGFKTTKAGTTWLRCSSFCANHRWKKTTQKKYNNEILLDLSTMYDYVSKDFND